MRCIHACCVRAALWQHRTPSIKLVLWNPLGMVNIFTKMGRMEQRDGGDRIPGFLRTHPHSSDR